MSLPNSASSRLLPERKPSPTPTSRSKDPTPHAMPNMVRNERNLCAHRLRKICPKMSVTLRITRTSKISLGARLKLGQQMPDVRLDRLLRQEQPDADLAVHQAVGDQLEHLDLPHRRLLLELAKRGAERDHLGLAGLAAGCGGVEATLMVAIAGENLLALGGVHARAIGGPRLPL